MSNVASSSDKKIKDITWKETTFYHNDPYKYEENNMIWYVCTYYRITWEQHSYRGPTYIWWVYGWVVDMIDNDLCQWLDYVCSAIFKLYETIGL